MSEAPRRIFLDTNVYLVGTAFPDSPERKILAWAGFFDEEPNGKVEVIVSEELFDQLLRVAKRLQNKDWAGEILGRIWQGMTPVYVLLPAEVKPEDYQTLPREDIGIYLTAQIGQAQCFVSSNKELIRSLVDQTGEFDCLTAEEFIQKYL